MLRSGATVGRLVRSRPAQLALIVLVGAVLRLWGILHGLADGFIYHADAHLAVWSAWHLYLGGPLGHARFGAAHGVLSRLALEAVDLAARAVGYPPQWSFALVGSVLALLTAVMGTLTIPAVHALGRRAFGRRAGLLAAAFVAVSPLHSFHSHYPYRDVPMVLALTLTLAACVSLAARPRALAYAGAAVGTGLTIALKPAGLVVAAPLAAALALAWRRRRVVWVGLATLVLLLVVLAGVSVFQTGRSLSPLVGARDRAHFAVVFLTRHGSTVGHGAARAVGLLAEWLGWPGLLASGLGLAVAVWRRRLADLVLLAFLVPAFLAAAAIPWMDERFFVYLVPPAAVLVARLLVGAADRARGRPLARLAVLLLGLALLAGDLGRSAWQDVLLSLPDTRALAGRWFEAHVPRSTRVAMEGYFPLGVNEWPRASFFEPRRPLSEALTTADVLVTSSLEHDRYLDPRRVFPGAPGTFFRALPQEVPLMRTFALAPLGFAHPSIAVYATRPPRVTGAPALFLPRPYDHAWDGGVAFLDPGPYDRDDRTLLLGGAQDHDVVLAAPSPVDEVAVFVLNGPETSGVRVEVGWTTRRRALEPGEWQVLRFRPRWWWPTRPALYRLRIGFLPEGRTALFQIRAGPREIGEAYGVWGRWEAAVPYLERALAARPGDGEVLLLLGTAYRQLGRAEDARRIGARLETEAPGYVGALRRLAETADRPEAWAPVFERATGLDPRLLAPALTREVRVDALLARGRLGGDPMTPGAVALVFERGVDSPGVVLNGPRGPRPLLYLAPGAYRARFTLRGGAGSAGQESAVLRVFAERRLLAAEPVRTDALGDGRRVVEVSVPFVHEGPPMPVALQVEATGRGSFAVDRMRIEPDLPETFRQRWRAIQALGG
ncbi:MAG TPA: glycosyltransferase family 39 protein [Methylomirabilota bacterium]|jgi:4-amino-4-deoxy-L-arabinose transferase-like glycosyltransferase